MSRFSWIHNPALDVALALAWVPFALAAWALLDNRAALNTLLAGVFLLSFSHQPLTLAFVYGDPAQFRLKRAIFTWAPFCFIVAALVGRNISLALVAAVAGLWNAEHTLMQRYGVTRIYGRKAGDTHGMLEKLMLISWLVLALVWVAADSRTGGFLQRLDLGATNADGVEVLQTLRPWAQWLLIPTVATVVALIVAWLRVEWQRRESANPAKYVYVGSTAVLFVVMLVNPIVGLMGYVAAHAIEYFAIVNQTLGKRYKAQPGGGALGRAVRLPFGRPLFYVTYIGMIAVIAFSLKWHGDPTLYAVVYLTLGGMHVFYDGFIWKLRRPEVANSVGATA